MHTKYALTHFTDPLKGNKKHCDLLMSRDTNQIGRNEELINMQARKTQLASKSWTLYMDLLAKRHSKWRFACGSIVARNCMLGTHPYRWDKNMRQKRFIIERVHVLCQIKGN